MSGWTCALFSSGLDSAVLAGIRGARAKVHPVYVSAGLAGKRRSLAPLDRLARGRTAIAIMARRSRRLTVHGRAISIRRRTGRCAAEPPAFDTPDEDVYLDRPQHRALQQGGDLLRAAKHRAHRDRAARGQSVSGCHARVLRRRWRRRCRLDSRTSLAIDAPLVAHAQERRDSSGCGAGRAVRADAVMHEPASGAALRPAQGAASGATLSRGRHRRSHRLCVNTHAVTFVALTEKILIEASPLRSRSVRPRAPLSELRAERSRFSRFSRCRCLAHADRQAIGINTAITGVRIEVGIEIRRQPKRDRAASRPVLTLNRSSARCRRKRRDERAITGLASSMGDLENDQSSTEPSPEVSLDAASYGIGEVTEIEPCPSPAGCPSMRRNRDAAVALLSPTVPAGSSALIRSITGPRIDADLANVNAIRGSPRGDCGTRCGSRRVDQLQVQARRRRFSLPSQLILTT